MGKGEERKEKNIPIALSWPPIFRLDHAKMHIIIYSSKRGQGRRKNRGPILSYS